MKSPILHIHTAIAAAILLSGCAHTKSVLMATPEPLWVPTTSLVQNSTRPINPYQILSAEDADLYAQRNERGAFGALPMGGISAFSTYTYEAQPISTLNGFGYRYRSVYQEGVSAPPAP